MNDAALGEPVKGADCAPYHDSWKVTGSYSTADDGYCGLSLSGPCYKATFTDMSVLDGYKY